MRVLTGGLDRGWFIVLLYRIANVYPVLSASIVPMMLNAA
jgi:hypothetical protein